MRVLLTTDTIGGVWTFTKELAAELLRLEHSVALASFGRAPSQEQLDWCSAINARHGRNFRYEASTLPLEWMNSNDTAYKDGEFFLRRIADDFCPDFLHSNQFCFGRLPFQIPKVVTAHSDVLSWAAVCRPDGLEPSPWLTRYCEMVKWGLAATDAVVAPTQWMLNALGQNFPLPARARVILNGRSLRGNHSKETRLLQAVSAGRMWDEAKHLAILAEVRSAIPIFIAGDREHQGATAPERVGNAVQVGQLTESDLLILFWTSSVYLATSIYEPFGLAPLEAALCGCAILANDIPSFREVWGPAALYYKNAAILSDLLAQLKASPKILLEAQRRAGQRALQLSATRMATEYLALYTELLSPKALSPTAMEGLATYAS